eukprot:TRINITY_DN12732_c0_g1_i1.p1 TRINITY_DN12732_c0_g1~~TRINITY_DN12732_c0_g1_i1.p1  ORF type:complete len:419 (-),score=88.18 TRINITY_DN12732_c0_g1_i1:78-1292(-)
MSVILDPNMEKSLEQAKKQKTDDINKDEKIIIAANPGVSKSASGTAPTANGKLRLVSGAQDGAADGLNLPSISPNGAVMDAALTTRSNPKKSAPLTIPPGHVKIRDQIVPIDSAIAEILAHTKNAAERKDQLEAYGDAKHVEQLQKFNTPTCQKRKYSAVEDQALMDMAKDRFLLVFLDASQTGHARILERLAELNLPVNDDLTRFLEYNCVGIVGFENSDDAQLAAKEFAAAKPSVVQGDLLFNHCLAGFRIPSIESVTPAELLTWLKSVLTVYCDDILFVDCYKQNKDGKTGTGGRIAMSLEALNNLIAKKANLFFNKKRIDIWAQVGGVKDPRKTEMVLNAKGPHLKKIVEETLKNAKIEARAVSVHYNNITVVVDSNEVRKYEATAIKYKGGIYYLAQKE